VNWNERLKQTRTARGITKSDLAKTVGVSAPTMTDWESGEIKRIDGENLLRLSDALGVSPHWLMWGKPASVSTDQEVHEIAAAILRVKNGSQKEAILAQLKAFGAL
jgi:transcriptional regulator with XRE-family HTH domain